MNFLDKVRTAISKDTSQRPTSSPKYTSTLQTNCLPPTSQDLLRYRSHHGSNLGSIFVLEKWLYPSMFEPGAEGDSELAAVTA